MMIGAESAWARSESVADWMRAAGFPASWTSSRGPNAPKGTDDWASVPTTHTGAPRPSRSATCPAKVVLPTPSVPSSATPRPPGPFRRPTTRSVDWRGTVTHPFGIAGL